MAHADTFENRLVATAIVDESRHPFILEARVALAEAPRIAAALTQTRIVIASAASLHFIDLPDANAKKPWPFLKNYARHMYRMHDLSEFMKGVMQRFCLRSTPATPCDGTFSGAPLDVAA